VSSFFSATMAPLHFVGADLDGVTVRSRRRHRG
jgi:hypothetical protein